MTDDPRNGSGADRRTDADHPTTADVARSAPQPAAPAAAPVEREREIPAQQEGRPAAQGAAAAPRGSATPGRTNDAESTPLFAQDEATDFRNRWTNIQAAFVDEPRRAVENADELVANTMQRLAEIFAHERKQLEEQWARGGDVSTEDLRQALRRYHAFFDRLLSV